MNEKIFIPLENLKYRIFVFSFKLNGRQVLYALARNRPRPVHIILIHNLKKFHLPLSTLYLSRFKKKAGTYYFNTQLKTNSFSLEVHCIYLDLKKKGRYILF